MVELQTSKLAIRVRFPLPAPLFFDPMTAAFCATPKKNGSQKRTEWEKLERETGIEPATFSLGS